MQIHTGNSLVYRAARAVILLGVMFALSGCLISKQNLMPPSVRTNSFEGIPFPSSWRVSVEDKEGFIVHLREKGPDHYVMELEETDDNGNPVFSEKRLYVAHVRDRTIIAYKASDDFWTYEVLGRFAEDRPSFIGRLLGFQSRKLATAQPFLNGMKNLFEKQPLDDREKRALAIMRPYRDRIRQPDGVVAMTVESWDEVVDLLTAAQLARMARPAIILERLD